MQWVGRATPLLDGLAVDPTTGIRERRLFMKSEQALSVAFGWNAHRKFNHSFETRQGTCPR